MWHANHFAVFLFGQNQHNKLAIGILTETFAGAGGARAWADGIEVGGEIPNPISRMANVETVEYTFPIRYLYRRRLRDSGGPGRYRGGVGMELSFVPHDAPDGGMHYVVSGKGSKFPMSEGLAGGYPGSPNAYIWVKNNGAKEDAIPGDQQAVDWGVFPLMGKDALYVRWNGGGGYGDPLSRPPQDVARDIRDGLTSPEFAESVYGVIIDTGTGEAKPSLTEKKRTELVAQRKNGGQSESVTGAPVTCKHCGQSLGGTDGNWKESVSVQETPMHSLGGPYASGGEVLLRSFSCPGCGILVDTETAMQGDPYLNDRLLIRR